jgi:small-conductance mechanosensitive channel
VDELLEHSFLGNSALRWIVAVATAVVVTGVLALVKRAGIARLRGVSARTKNPYDDAATRALEETKAVAILGAGLAAGARTLTLPPDAELWLGRALVVVLAVQIGLWATAIVRELFDASPARSSPGATTVGRAVAFTTRLVVWSLVVVLVLSNFGVEVGTLIAGLGIGGIAAALAVQNVLGDLFAAFSIYVDRPFDIGDFVVVDSYMGTVERIGWRSTQLSSISGEQIVLANSDLARSRIRNFKRMSERRVVIQFGVEHDTPPSALVRVPAIVREEIEKHERLRFDRAHLAALGEAALQFEAVYFVRSPDFDEHMDLQQKVLLALLERLGAEEIRFALPARLTVARPPAA